LNPLSLIRELQEALAKVKTLSDMLPICAGCKKIRDDKGYWNQLEDYISEHSEALFTHGLCPACLEKAYAEVEEITKRRSSLTRVLCDELTETCSQP
jgi:hypothetical protein